ncbi:hypothetical protein AYO21_11625 [Fonsecaea monophora]|uniref:Uncharacterized protein n=1 Tax=Fonsecaea monophora TaxID=254056 RepID=A0A177ETB0_9EURO|nr:hypothetical protein AYO21_11625 [Fonsecaea monophora]KAH0830007.1 hypothetical protein FOPE_10843 [Fonsecaea pedrosoi]OAG34229.1 hypothetical protein AYO21_11625 [Fonsecaea monophora]
MNQGSSRHETSEREKANWVQKKDRFQDHQKDCEPCQTAECTRLKQYLYSILESRKGAKSRIYLDNNFHPDRNGSYAAEVTLTRFSANPKTAMLVFEEQPKKDPTVPYTLEFEWKELKHMDPLRKIGIPGCEISTEIL